MLRQNLANVTPVFALDVAGHSYSVAFGQLQDVNAQGVGLLGVAVDREPLAAARRRASTTLVLGAILALLLAIALANLLARRLTRPLQDLHAGALSIARGDLDTSITVDSDDEIGDVAEAFRVMTRSLKENQEGLAARVRELVTVHQVGRAVSSVVDLGSGAELGRRRGAVTVLNGKTAASWRWRSTRGRHGTLWCAPSPASRSVASWRPWPRRWRRWAGRGAPRRSRPIRSSWRRPRQPS